MEKLQKFYTPTHLEISSGKTHAPKYAKRKFSALKSDRIEIVVHVEVYITELMEIATEIRKCREMAEPPQNDFPAFCFRSRATSAPLTQFTHTCRTTRNQSMIKT